MRYNWRTYLNKNKRGSFVYITASTGSHIGGDVEEEEMSEEEGNNHAIDS